MGTGHRPEAAPKRRHATSVTAAIREFFVDSRIDPVTYRHRVAAMPGPDADDHVHSAAALTAGASALITWDEPGFPVEDLAAPRSAGRRSRHLPRGAPRHAPRRGPEHDHRARPNQDQAAHVDRRHPRRLGTRRPVRAASAPPLLLSCARSGSHRPGAAHQAGRPSINGGDPLRPGASRPRGAEPLRLHPEMSSSPATT